MSIQYLSKSFRIVQFSQCWAHTCKFCVRFLGGSITLHLASGEPRANMQPTTASLLNLDTQDIPLERCQAQEVRPSHASQATEKMRQKTLSFYLWSQNKYTPRCNSLTLEDPRWGTSSTSAHNLSMAYVRNGLSAPINGTKPICHFPEIQPFPLPTNFTNIERTRTPVSAQQNQKGPAQWRITSHPRQHAMDRSYLLVHLIHTHLADITGTADDHKPENTL